MSDLFERHQNFHSKLTLFFKIHHPLDFILLSLFPWNTALLPPAAEDQQMLIRSQWVFLIS